MAYARPFNQTQGASPWSSGVPPGLQQPQQAPANQQAQQMFNQPMGAFDLSGAWQGQQQAGQWAAPMQPMQQPIQFVPNPAFMQQPPPQQIQHHHHQQQQQRFQQQQRPMHQRSLSAPRIGVNGPNRRGNQNNSFGGGSGGGGGGQWQQRQPQHNNTNNNNQQQQQRNTRQQSRQQKVQFSNNNNNNNNNNNTKQQNQQRQQQQQQQQPQQKQKQQQHQQQQQQQTPKKGTVKVTKVVKKQVLKAKQGVAKVKSADSAATNDKATVAATNDQQTPSTVTNANKPQSKTAERKQLKLQARKNAEGLKETTLPVIKSKKLPSESRDDGDKPIDQAQLKCVPAVFGFVCKACNVFLRDRFARREHIDSDDHMQKFKEHEEEFKKLKDASEEKTEPLPATVVADSGATDDQKASPEEEQKPETAPGEEAAEQVENEETPA